VVTWRADFFNEWDDLSPSRSMIISANTDDEIVKEAEADMRGAARVELIRPTPKGRFNRRRRTIALARL